MPSVTCERRSATSVLQLQSDDAYSVLTDGWLPVEGEGEMSIGIKAESVSGGICAPLDVRSDNGWRLSML